MSENTKMIPGLVLKTPRRNARDEGTGSGLLRRQQLHSAGAWAMHVTMVPRKICKAVRNTTFSNCDMYEVGMPRRKPVAPRPLLLFK